MCLYIPFALSAQQDVAAAEACRRAYVDLIDHVQDLERVASAAAQGEADPKQVGTWRQQCLRATQPCVPHSPACHTALRATEHSPARTTARDA